MPCRNALALVTLLALVAFAAPGLSPTPDTLAQGGVLDLRSAQWEDPEGTVQTGLNGEGVLVYNDEHVNPHPDIQACLDRGSPNTIMINDLGLPAWASNAAHGTETAGVLCGDGAMSTTHGTGEAITGVAPGMGLITKAHQCATVQPTRVATHACPLFDHHPIRVFSHSIGEAISGSNPSPMERSEWYGAAPDADVLFATSAGNEGGDGVEARTPSETGTDERLMVVAAANGDATDIAEYSSRGAKDDPATWPDITAPGCMLTTSPLNGWQSTYGTFQRGLSNEAICANMDPPALLTYEATGYSQATGTSFATPFVSGVAALMLEVNPSLHAEDAKHLITHTAQPFIPIPGNPDPTPMEFHDEHGYKAGYGLVDATAATAAAHYLTLNPHATPQEAIDCSTTQQTPTGQLVLNPNEGTC